MTRARARATARVLTTGALAAGCFAFATPAMAANDADLDPSFGKDGAGEALFTDPFGERLGTSDVVAGADGRITQLTGWDYGYLRGISLSSGRVQRFTAGGLPDLTFGDAGQAEELPPFLAPRALHVLPDGGVLVASSPQYLLREGETRGEGGGITLTRYTPAGAIDTAFGEEGTLAVALDGCSGGQVLGFRPDGLLAVFTLGCETPEGGYDAARGKLAVVGQDGVVDAGRTAEVGLGDVLPEGADPLPLKLAFAVVGGQVRTYVGTAFAAGGTEPVRGLFTGVQTAVTAVQDGGVVAGFGQGGTVVEQGFVFDLDTTAAGEPQLLSLVTDAEEEDVRWRVRRFTTAGGDAPFGEGGLHVIDGDVAAPEGLDRLRLLSEQAIDRLGRTYLTGNDQLSEEQDPVEVARAAERGLAQDELPAVALRLTPAGAPDPAFGEQGTRQLPAPAGATRFAFNLFGGLFYGDGDQATIQPDGKLLLGTVLRPAYVEGEEQQPEPQGSLLRLSGTTPEPELEPELPPQPQPQPPAPQPPATGTGKAVTPKACASRRKFTIRLKPGKRKLVSATVTLAGKKVKVRKGKRITATIDLRGKPAGAFKVVIEAKDAKGRKVREVRTFRTCTPGALKLASVRAQ